MKKNIGGIEYKMTKTMFQELLKTRDDAETKQNPYNFVMQVLNDTYGLKGQVSHIILTD